VRVRCLCVGVLRWLLVAAAGGTLHLPPATPYPVDCKGQDLCTHSVRGLWSGLVQVYSRPPRCMRSVLQLRGCMFAVQSWRQCLLPT
jgi:hypothetical protein